MGKRPEMRRVMVAAVLVACLGSGCSKAPGTPATFIDWHDPDLDKKISAYVPLVKQIDADGGRPTSLMDVAVAERIGKEWSDAADRGELKALSPLYLDESLLEGPTGQIFSAQRRICDTLLLDAGRRLEGQEVDKGLDIIEEVFKIIEPTLRSDLQTLTSQSLSLRRGLSLISANEANYTPAQKTRAMELVRRMAVNGKEVATFAKTMRRLAIEYRLRYGGQMPQQVPGADMEAIENMTFENAEETMVKVRADLAAKQVPEGMENLVSILQRALASEIATQKRVNQILGNPTVASVKNDGN